MLDLASSADGRRDCALRHRVGRKGDELSDPRPWSSLDRREPTTARSLRGVSNIDQDPVARQEKPHPAFAPQGGARHRLHAFPARSRADGEGGGA